MDASPEIQRPGFLVRIRLHSTGANSGRSGPLAVTSQRSYRPHFVPVDANQPLLGVFVSWSSAGEIHPGDTFDAVVEFMYPNAPGSSAAETEPGRTYRVVEGAREVGVATFVGPADDD